MVKNKTCNSLTLSWKHPLDKEVKAYEIWRNGVFIKTLPYQINTQIYTDKGLESATKYKYRIVTIDKKNQPSTKALQLSDITLSGIKHNLIPLAASMIKNPSSNAIKLIDEQNVYDPTCASKKVPNGNFWGPNYQSETKEKVIFDLKNSYDIKDIYLHDGGGISGKVEIFKGKSAAGPWEKIISYEMVKFGEWVNFNNPAPNKSIRYLKIEASKDDNVAIGELFICGRAI